MRPLLLLLPLLVLTACRVEDAPAAPAEPAPQAQEAAIVPASAVAPADAPTVTVYKSPTCGCCSMWVEHLEASGFEVESVDRTDMGAVKDSLGVPSHLSSCHTAVVGDYVVEGHVPAEHVARMLEEQPAGRGLAVPGMPIGSPGMEQGDRRDPYDVIVFDEAGDGAVFAHVEGNTRP
ncbi:DUF411 domain-containing protein [Rubrivirga marina]|uniref:DUF411 domain-containing protein n=1 Tax=Rubrivirga marina TaxID=1196024 RepID=UPI000BA9BF39|nr:DUF411 domain-containing protein [Rubrivirga marina]